ncbi:MAG: DNA mismatch repair endonuclease MutL [Bacilli bacterium]|nr:DNA mismatch repair endonuclease MutL [Bacilli bacterium]MDD7549871.1 DNA mismatch repair endonuclease MutL [Bacilli bacterium]MDY4828793.1 DNA mismatch repair endonuclease MutL [Bacilli bacterium]MDY5744916.1 DNA mismatch repair endonuclease MutL [Bacilli bacterium]MDY6008564.1 DNA mismatch repair endonuclease MutL [Bacilli bacterium]
MNRINLMSPELANMIAAGEVIERPSSVIKELVENSIDAKATRIEVDIYDVGRKLIRVKDDGFGMSREDAKLAFKRHASSKVKSVYDLMRITSLGFRGEALPSIASVSNVILLTSDGEEGTKICLSPSKEMEVSDAALRKGTTFEIRDLFFNTPARMKYLKSDKTENASSIEVMEHLSMCYSDVSFVLRIDGKTIFETTGRGDLKEVIALIYGKEVAKKLLEVSFEGEGYSFSGYIGEPSISYSTRYDILNFLNRRSVYVPKVQKAFIDAYKDYLPPSRYPFVAVNFSVDYSLVDVNVHPTKREVRLSIEEEVASNVYKEVKRSLLLTRQSFVSSSISGATLTLEQPTLKEDDFANIFEENEKKQPQEAFKDVVTLFDEFDKEEKENYIKDSLIVEDDVSPRFESKTNFPSLTLIGQVFDTYLLAQGEDGLYFIDQHAAAERINFEKCEDDFNSSSSRVVPLIPLVIELPYSSLTNYDKEHILALESLNIYTSSFGGNAIKVDEIPSYLSEEDDESVLRDIILSTLKGNKVDIASLKRLSIASRACKMSLKANRLLTREEQLRLLRNLAKCRNPLNCPHGRPTIVKVSKYDLEKMFKRTGF